MSARTSCPQCGNVIEVIDRLPEDVRCPSCGSVFKPDEVTTAAGARAHLPQTIGRFHIMEMMGTGAFGLVYKARDTELDRTVAVKVPRAVTFPDDPSRDRFLREARSLAQLRHPGIVSLHEIGHSGTGLFLVSEFVEGMTLADRLSAGRPSYSWAADVAAQLAEALQYAHEHGVIHRDIKPTNVMLRDDRTPQITDFGLAKRDAGEITMTVDGDVLGTPAYMSPEQARGEAHSVDGRADVYSLGVILYQMLTGELPFRGTSRMLMHQVLTEDPRPPRRLNDEVPRDLETICLKAMAKAKDQRYSLAGELAEDLRRYLRGEPIHARPATSVERAVSWVRRRPVISLLAGLLAAAIGTGGGAVTWQWRLAERSRAEAERNLYFQTVAHAHSEWASDNVESAAALLASCPPELRGWEWFHLRRLCSAELVVLRGHEDTVEAVAFDPSGIRLASASFDGVVKVWDAKNWRHLRDLRGHQGPVKTLAFSPDGSWLASAGRDGQIKLWRMPDGAEQFALRGHSSEVSSIGFLPDGHRLVSGSSGRPVPQTLPRHLPDGHRLAPETSREDGTLRLWDLRARRMLWSLSPAGGVASVAVHPDGTTVAAAAAFDTRMGTWDVETARALWTKEVHGILTRVCYHPGDGSLISITDDGVTFWNVARGVSGIVAGGSPQSNLDARALAVSVDGSIAFAGGDRNIHIRSGRSQLEITLRGHSEPAVALAFSADGTRLASAGQDRTVRVWDPRHPPAVAVLPLGASIAFAPDGGVGAWIPTRYGSSSPARLSLVNAESADEVRTLTTTSGLGGGLFFSPDGSRIGSWLRQEGDASSPTVSIRDATTGRKLFEFDDDRLLPSPTERQGSPVITFGGREAFFSPDGRWIVSASGNSAVVRDARTGAERFLLRSGGAAIRRIVFDGYSDRLGASTGDRLTVWSLRDGVRLGEIKGTGEFAFGADDVIVRVRGDRDLTVPTEVVVFDGKTVRERFSARQPVPSELVVLDGKSGRERLSVRQPGSFRNYRISPDGTRIVSGGVDGAARIWDLRTGRQAGVFRGHRGEVVSVDYSPDGRRLATLGDDAKLRIWDVASGRSLLILDIPGQIPSGAVGRDSSSVYFSPDGGRLATLLTGRWYLWNGASIE